MSGSSHRRRNLARVKTEGVIHEEIAQGDEDRKGVRSRGSWDKRSFVRNDTGVHGRAGGRVRLRTRGRRVEARAGPAVSAHGPSDAVVAIGYTRVSTEEQSVSGAGLAAQRSQIEAEVARRGWRLLDVIEDAGYSGRDLRRPGVRVALAALRDGEAEALVVAKVDRLSRSMVDFTALMDRLRARDGPSSRSTSAWTRALRVVRRWPTSWRHSASSRRRLIGQRTKEALAVKRAQGVRLGRPPVLSTALVERMRRERDAGATLQAIADGLERDGIPTAQGGRRWHAATVRDVIRSSADRTDLGGPSALRD